MQRFSLTRSVWFYWPHACLPFNGCSALICLLCAAMRHLFLDYGYDSDMNARLHQSTLALFYGAHSMNVFLSFIYSRLQLRLPSYPSLSYYFSHFQLSYSPRQHTGFLLQIFLENSAYWFGHPSHSSPSVTRYDTHSWNRPFTLPISTSITVHAAHDWTEPIWSDLISTALLVSCTFNNHLSFSFPSFHSSIPHLIFLLSILPYLPMAKKWFGNASWLDLIYLFTFRLSAFTNPLSFCFCLCFPGFNSSQLTSYPLTQLRTLPRISPVYSSPTSHDYIPPREIIDAGYCLFLLFTLSFYFCLVVAMICTIRI